MLTTRVGSPYRFNPGYRLGVNTCLLVTETGQTIALRNPSSCNGGSAIAGHQGPMANAIIIPSEEVSMLQNKQIVLSTLSGYLDYLQEQQPDLSPEAAYQIAATLTQAEFNLQLAESTRKP